MPRNNMLAMLTIYVTGHFVYIQSFNAIMIRVKRNI